jgi:hypothetical protein
MQKERKLRHQTPRELLRDLEHLRETQLQEARKPRAPQSTKKKKTGRPRRRR